MKFAYALLAVLALILVALPSARADSGYTYNAATGRYNRGLYEYVRSEPLYYNYWTGCCYERRVYYTYTLYSPPLAAIKPPPYSPDWKTESIKFLAKREDYQTYLAFLNGAGYPTSVTYGAAGNVGSTVYGNIQTNKVDLVGPALDLSVLYQQASTAVKQAGDIYGTVGTGFQGLVEQADRNRAETTKMIVLRDLLIALQQNRASFTSGSQTWTINKGPGGVSIDPVKPTPPPVGGDVPAGDSMAKAVKVVQANCLQCHDGGKNGFQANDWAKMDSEARMKIVRERIFTNDPKMKMPKPPNQPLSRDEALALVPE